MARCACLLCGFKRAQRYFCQGVEVHLPDRIAHGRSFADALGRVGFHGGHLDLSRHLHENYEEHRAPLTNEMLEIIEPLKAMKSEFVFEGQQRHTPLSDMAMLMLLRRMDVEGVTIHGFRSTFRVWASEAIGEDREVSEMSLSHKIGNAVEQAYARFDLLDRRRLLMEKWSNWCSNEGA